MPSCMAIADAASKIAPERKTKRISCPPVIRRRLAQPPQARVGRIIAASASGEHGGGLNVRLTTVLSIASRRRRGRVDEALERIRRGEKRREKASGSRAGGFQEAIDKVDGGLRVVPGGLGDGGAVSGGGGGGARRPRALGQPVEGVAEAYPRRPRHLQDTGAAIFVRRGENLRCPQFAGGESKREEITQSHTMAFHY
uniref:Uncharacterized protein n=1 Tax=Oryza meridionalis TaxID=40149 RepID=A0A0E0C0V4_9ORYZ